MTDVTESTPNTSGLTSAPPLLVGSLASVLVLLVLALLLRWTFDKQDGLDAAPVDEDDFGLLEDVAVVPHRSMADDLCQQLRAEGLRATSAPLWALDPRGEQRILVFPDDAEVVRFLLSEQR